jgi:hypothetical protein
VLERTGCAGKTRSHMGKTQNNPRRTGGTIEAMGLETPLGVGYSIESDKTYCQ